MRLANQGNALVAASEIRISRASPLLFVTFYALRDIHSLDLAPQFFYFDSTLVPLCC